MTSDKYCFLKLVSITFKIFRFKSSKSSGLSVFSINVLIGKLGVLTIKRSTSLNILLISQLRPPM